MIRALSGPICTLPSSSPNFLFLLNPLLYLDSSLLSQSRNKPIRPSASSSLLLLAIGWLSMETLAASSSSVKPFLENHSYKLHTTTYFLSQQKAHPPPTAARDVAAAALFLTRPKKHHHHRHHHPLARCSYCFPSLSGSVLHRSNILPVSSSATVSVLSASQTQTLAEDEAIQTKHTTEFKTVRVKFELRRECSFGDQFLMVGDDPMFGLWDPENAIPLNWSDGHVWTVELDIPCDKVMKYKFILKEDDDDILWQPGPDRILQTWDTEKVITVSEDWDSAELQIIVEEDPVIHKLSEGVEDSTEDLFPFNGDPESYLENELTSENGYFQPTEAVLVEEPVADIIAEQSGEKEGEANGFPVADFTPNTDINMESGAPARVLVLGMTPLPTAETEEEESVKHIHPDSSSSIPEPCLKEEPGTDSLGIPKEETETWLNNKHGVDGEGGHVEVEDPELFGGKEQHNSSRIVEKLSVLENDFGWGRRTLQQLLVNMGFIKHNL